MSTVDAAIIKNITKNKWNEAIDATYMEPLTLESGPIQWTKDGENLILHTNDWVPNKIQILRLKTTDGRTINMIPTGGRSYTQPENGEPITYSYSIRYGEKLETYLFADKTDNGTFITIRKNPNKPNPDQFEIPDNINTGIFQLKYQNADTIIGFIINSAITKATE